MYCDIFLFCLWKKSRKFWDNIIDTLKNEYQITFYQKTEFPNSINILKEFYNNEYLVGGYDKKLEDIQGRFIFCICKDKELNNYKKLYDLKKQIRNLSDYENDYNFIHSSNSVPELIRQLKIIGGFQWL
jgi:hypothetical protein